MTWYYAENDQPRGPFDDAAWAAMVAGGKIQPDTMVWHDGLEGWVRYAQLNSAPDAPAVVTPPAFAPGSVTETESEYRARILQKDYRVDIGGCIGRSWDLLKQNFWPLVGATLVIYAIIIGASEVPCLGLAVPFALKGVFLGGLFWFFLKTIRGEQPEFAELFAGFHGEAIGQLALKTLVTTLVALACFAPGIIFARMSGVFDLIERINPAVIQDQTALLNAINDLIENPQAQLSVLFVLLGSMPAVYFTFVWVFAIPLIIDRRMKFNAAMKLSHRKVLQHPWKISLLLIVAGFLAVLGFFGFCISVIFTAPIYTAALAYLYLDIFDERKAG